MKVFISWSGAKSRAVALVLREELPVLINELEIFVSSEDIEKGTPWFQKITSELEQSGFAIICLTPENLESRWVHFEAGAFAGKLSQAKVAPLLIELENTDVPQPLAGLNLTKFDKEDFLKLLRSINNSTAKPISDSVLAKTFERSWGHIKDTLEEKIMALPDGTPIAKRSQEEILDEILTMTRAIVAHVSPANNLTSGIEEYLSNLKFPHDAVPTSLADALTRSHPVR